MRLTISKKISFLLLLMVIIAVANILITYYYQNLQKFDSHILNMAGKQRMLSQKISKLAFSVANGNDSDRQLLSDIIGLYESTLKILHHGGRMKVGIVPHAPSIMWNLFNENKDLWDLFKENAEIIVKESRDNPLFSEALSFVETNDELLLERSNDVVKAYESLPNFKEFAHEINVAGRQRMLSEKISKYDHKIAIMRGVETRKKLQTAMELYEKSLLTLRDGGISIPWGKEIKAPPPAVKEALGSLEDFWKGFKLKLNVIQKTPRDNRVFREAIDYLRQNDEELLRISDKVTVMFEQIFSEKVFSLRMLLIIMLVFDIFIFFMGYIMAARIAQPIRDLSKFARKIGEGDFSQKMDVPRFKDETMDLANAFNKMIGDLKKTTFSKNYVDNILKSMTNSLVVVNADAIINRVNGATCSLLGYQEKELIGKPINFIFAVKGFNIIDELTKKGFIGNIEKAYLSKDGRRIPVLFSGSLMRDSDGKVQGIICMAEDITEYKRTEKMLFYKSKLIQLSQEITITSNEASTVNEALQVCLDKVCDYMGWPIGHVYVANSAGTLTSSSLWYIENPEQFETFRTVTEATPFDPGIGLPGRVMANGKPVWIEDVTKDTNFPRAKLAKSVGIKAGFGLPVLEGKKVAAVLEFFSKEAIEPDEATLETLSNLATQLGRVTEKKRAQEELNRLGKAIEQTGEIVIITDIDANIQYINPSFEKVTGYRKEEVIGQNPRILQSGKQDDFFYQKMWETLKEGKVWHGHFIDKKKDGTFYEENATISPIFDDSGKIINYVAVKRDMTEEIRLQKQQRQSQKLEAIGTLAGGIAHDFNNILTGIIGYSELSLDKIPEDNEVSGNLKQILNSSYRARDLVKQILSFSRQEKHEFKQLNLSLVIKETLKMIKSTLPSNIEICVNIEEKTCSVKADLTLIHQVIMNLCVNAEHAMREKGGVLEVNLDLVNVDASLAQTYTHLKEGAYAKITISDTGHGIKNENMERIFDPFFTTKEVGEGTGMGLSTVHGIIKELGGEITVYSEVGKGTTFKVFLPKIDDIITAKESLQTQHIPRGNGERILFVDDEASIVHIAQKMLENWGYEVVGKNSSLEVLEMFKAAPQSFDIVITDQAMPNMTGEELAKKIIGIRHDIPIILCSGYSHTITREKAEAIGIRKFIMKPFIVRDFAVAIRKILDKEKRTTPLQAGRGSN